MVISPSTVEPPPAPRLPTPLECPTVAVETAAWALGISRSAAYVAARSGELPAVQVGHRVRVLTAPLRRMLGLDEHVAKPTAPRRRRTTAPASRSRRRVPAAEGDAADAS
jgi:excisionase family DNA binding protein